VHKTGSAQYGEAAAAVLRQEACNTNAESNQAGILLYRHFNLDLMPCQYLISNIATQNNTKQSHTTVK
jgi:hypothetical protein